MFKMIYVENFLKSYEKFKKHQIDGINKKGLERMCLALGYPLTKYQLENAFSDLDRNETGYIEKDEFQRWFFTGLRCYITQELDDEDK